MWTRKELKQRGKARFYANYWKSVLAALLLSIILGNSIDFDNKIDRNDVRTVVQSPEVAIERITDTFERGDVHAIVDQMAPWMAPLFGAITLLVFVFTAAGICVKFFVFNPLEVGGRKYFAENLSDNAEIKVFGHAFTADYLNVVKTMFLRDLYTFLWSLLFVIPGIIKAYEYRMIPYLLAENSDMTTDEAFAVSKELMKGNKWDAFILDLSFLGWHILSALTLEILGVFFVRPYVYYTEAALYKKLAENNGRSMHSDYYVEVE